MSNFKIEELSLIGKWREFTLQTCEEYCLLFHNGFLVDIIDKEMAEKLKKKGVKEKKD